MGRILSLVGGRIRTRYFPSRSRLVAVALLVALVRSYHADCRLYALSAGIVMEYPESSRPTKAANEGFYHTLLHLFFIALITLWRRCGAHEALVRLWRHLRAGCEVLKIVM